MKHLLIAFLLITALSHAQSNDRPQREPFQLQLPIDGEQYYGMPVDKTPYFPKEKVLQVYPGEKLNIEVELRKDTIYAMKVVEKNLHPENTVELEFVQVAKDKKHEQMMLTVKNPFKKSLIYEAAMYTVNREDWVNTSIIPIRPGLTNFETWPDVIVTLVLHDWRLKDN
jgi:inner membrane protein involved in colicin E2 resistance